MNSPSDDEPRGMMDRMSDDELFRELSDLGTQETSAPPIRHAVPVRHLPPLEPRTLVTIGQAGWWWAIDELRVRSGPHEGPDGPWYSLEPLPEPGAGGIRERADDAPPWAAKVYGRRTSLDRIWVYRDDVTDRGRDEIQEPSSTQLLERINDVSQPPPVLRPWPAVRLPMLVGRRVRIPTADDSWTWAVCVTEPVQGTEDIAVGVVMLDDYWRMVYDTAPPDRRAVRYIPIHTVWCY